MFEWHANLVENAADNLAFWIEKTRDDRVAWAPQTEESTNTRSALELGSECVNVNRAMAAMFRGETPSGEKVDFKDVTSCITELRSSGKELGQSIRGLTPETVAKEYETPFGPMPGAMLMQIALNNMSYHGGQVNLIQLLYGDPRFYIPGRD